MSERLVWLSRRQSGQCSGAESQQIWPDSG